jgi:hypothetical protein
MWSLTTKPRGEVVKLGMPAQFSVTGSGGEGEKARKECASSTNLFVDVCGGTVERPVATAIERRPAVSALLKT